MTKKSKKKLYEGVLFGVLVPCRNKKKRFIFGDTVTSKDFPEAVIKNWLTLDPPVLEIISNVEAKPEPNSITEEVKSNGESRKE